MIPYEMPEVIAVENEISNPVLNREEEEEDRPVILVVKDDASLLEFISKSLKTENYRSIRATNGVEALNMLEANAVDLIISM